MSGSNLTIPSRTPQEAERDLTDQILTYLAHCIDGDPRLLISIPRGLCLKAKQVLVLREMAS